MDEKELRKKVDEQTENMEVPRKLQPEYIEKMLIKREEQKTTKEKEKRKKRRVDVEKWIVTAACLALVAGGLYLKSINLTVMMEAPADSAKKSEAVNSDTQTEGAKQKTERIKTADNYEEVYQHLNEHQRNIVYDKNIMEGVSADGMVVGAASPEASYSDTNIREEGVGESDIVKTDGKRIYTLTADSIQIVGIEQEKMEYLGGVPLSESGYGAEFFVKDDCLIIAYTKAEKELLTDGQEYEKNTTVVETFNISNPSAPKLSGIMEQSGIYRMMRIVGDYVYLFGDFYTCIPDGKENDFEMYIPTVNKQLIPCEDICMPMQKDGYKYTVVTSFAMAEPSREIDSIAILEGYSDCYVSANSIYVYEDRYADRYDGTGSSMADTCIRKVSYEDGELEGVGETVIEGRLNDTFSLDEYEGNLRLVATLSIAEEDPVAEGKSEPEVGEKVTDIAITQREVNCLYVLDENLEELSRIEDLAPGESVQSARFMGDIGYFVTFEQIDPLFSVDLSNPENPQIIGSLKIPGFSSYLHPYGEDFLVGIGMDIDEQSGERNGVKVSLFDISTPSNVQEVEKYTIEDTYGTAVDWTYKTVLIDESKNIIAFPAYGDGLKYYVFSYDEGKFNLLMEKPVGGKIDYDRVRMLYAKDKLYLVAENVIESFRLGTFEKVDDIVL